MTAGPHVASAALWVDFPNTHTLKFSFFLSDFFAIGSRMSERSRCYSCRAPYSWWSRKISAVSYFFFVFILRPFLKVFPLQAENMIALPIYALLWMSCIFFEWLVIFKTHISFIVSSVCSPFTEEVPAAALCARTQSSAALDSHSSSSASSPPFFLTVFLMIKAPPEECASL